MTAPPRERSTKPKDNRKSLSLPQWFLICGKPEVGPRSITHSWGYLCLGRLCPHIPPSGVWSCGFADYIQGSICCLSLLVFSAWAIVWLAVLFSWLVGIQGMANTVQSTLAETKLDRQKFLVGKRASLVRSDVKHRHM